MLSRTRSCGNVRLPQSTLRWWQREAPLLRPMRTKGGQRRYTLSYPDYNRFTII
ncbi:MAG: MerR family transcriptional regulator [Muribaculaceae bacterium]|nr:MerR family transcriptional regulator [Muribaculaceae bacterium]